MKWAAAFVVVVLAAGAAVWHGWYEAWLIPLSDERMAEYLAAQAPVERKLLALRQLERQPSRAARWRARLEDLTQMPFAEIRFRSAELLAGLGDKSVRHILAEMKTPHTVFAPYTGRLVYAVKAGQRVAALQVVARIGEREILSPLSGTVRAVYEPDHAVIRTGQRLLDITWRGQ